MNLKIILIVLAIAVTIATFFIETRLAPFVGAALLFAGMIYGWLANRSAGEANRERAERATHRQRETHTGPRA
ncbi:MAG: hypothetical protein V2I27_10540 [Erythrobacter sp.]|jgi:ABC-type transport system involved in cytochrome bd biosynthesis fused ATPase/permease subunit|nr:hypothetical protein [Erythrobacter sp.]